jgi:hypothetical protein
MQAKMMATYGDTHSVKAMARMPMLRRQSVPWGILSVCITLCRVGLSAAQAIDISGIVVDNATSAPIAGALLKLVEVPSVRDTTDAAGRFTLVGETTGLRQNQVSRAVHGSVRIEANWLTISGMGHAGVVSVDVFDCRGARLLGGRQVARANEALVFTGLGNARELHLVRIRAGDKEQVVTCPGAGARSSEITFVAAASATALGKEAAASAAYTIEIEKAGYQTKSVSSATATGSIGTIAMSALTGIRWLSGACCSPTQDFGTWRGSRVLIAGIWADVGENQRHPEWVLDRFSGWNECMEIAPGMIVKDAGESLAAAGRGAYLDRWRQAMGTVRSRWGSKKTIFIRPAHEMNGYWYPWSIHPGEAEDFKKAWRLYYQVIQDSLVRMGKDAKVTFCTNGESIKELGSKLSEYWPGDEYVDVYGTDYYDRYPSTLTEAEWEALANKVDALGNPRGIYQHIEFARAHGKPFALPEWGTDFTSTVDNPVFIKKMHELMVSISGPQPGVAGPGQLLYEVYYNTEKSVLYPSANVPQAAAMYRSLFH